RFQEEIKTAAGLTHPHVAKTFGADKAGDTHFLIREYLAGIDLVRLVGQRGQLRVVEAADYIRQAALGLQHAYAHGLVHHHLTPADLLFSGVGDLIKVLDLGLMSVAQSRKPDAPV